MTDIYIYCEICEEDVLVTKLELCDRSDSVDFYFTLKCGHDYPKRTRLEKGG